MAKYISPILRNIFNTALRTENVPEILRKGTIVSLFKNKGNRTDNNLRSTGMPEKLVIIIKNMYATAKARFRINNQHTKYIETIQGVPQGDPLSPIIFNMVIKPMLKTLEQSGISYKLVKNDRTADFF